MNFDNVFETIKDGVAELAKNAISAFANDAKTDLLEFLKDARKDLERWSKLLAQGQLTRDEFEFLVGAKATNAKMLTLSAKGIAKTKIKHLRDSLKDLIINTVVSAI